MIGDILASLGFLRDISDAIERKNKEDLLFNSVKHLVIEFLELADSPEKQEALSQQYRIHISMNMMGGAKILNHLIEYNTSALLLACRNIIQEKYRLTEHQTLIIIDIISQMKPSLIRDLYIGFGESQGKIVFCSPDEEVMDLERHQQAFINMDKITQRLAELRSGEWDNTIRTRIKELG